MKRLVFTIALIGILLTSGTWSVAAAGDNSILDFELHYIVTDLGTLGGTESFAYAINDSGKIVGYSRYPGDTSSAPALWYKRAITDLNALYGIGPGDYASMAEDINNLGQIVGNSSDGHAVLLSEGVVTDLGTFGGVYSTALGINNSGQIVGYYASPYGYHHAYLYSNGSITELGPFGADAISVAFAINDSGMIVGMAADSYKVPAYAFLYGNGVMTDISPFGNSESYARGINNRGQVVGEFLTQDSTAFHCFLYIKGKLRDLGTLGGPDCAAFAINERGDVVGSSPVQVGTEEYCDDDTVPPTCYEYPVYSWHGFLYKNGKMIDLNTLIPPDSGWELNWAYDINNKGRIVGYGTLNKRFRAFLLTPVPFFIPNGKKRGLLPY